MSKKVLGRGLGAFFPDLKEGENPEDSQSMPTLPPEQRERVNITMHIPVDSIRANPYQPRSEFDIFKLQELSDSIKQHGLIQPVTVRHLGSDRYELISGERRLRATRMAGMQTIPAYVREANDDEMIVFAIIENIQREQLNPIEVALGYQRLMDECSLTQEQVALSVGKNRTTVTNSLRLLNLPASIQSGLKIGKLSAGHARTLLSVENPQIQEKLYHKTLEEELSVRQLEDLTRNYQSDKKKAQKNVAKSDPADIQIREITGRLRRMFATKVDIKKKSKGGEIRIEYYSEDELEHILSVFDRIQD
jgi:ParB family chromosome partitioning protein